jgi:hypothetical protein
VTVATVPGTVPDSAPSSSAAITTDAAELLTQQVGGVIEQITDAADSELPTQQVGGVVEQMMSAQPHGTATQANELLPVAEHDALHSPAPNYSGCAAGATGTRSATAGAIHDVSAAPESPAKVALRSRSAETPTTVLMTPPVSSLVVSSHVLSPRADAR